MHYCVRQIHIGLATVYLVGYFCLLVCREFSGQSPISPQRSAHSLGGLPVGVLAVGRGVAKGERGLSTTKASGLSSSKKRGDAMRRSALFFIVLLGSPSPCHVTFCVQSFDRGQHSTQLQHMLSIT